MMMRRSMWKWTRFSQTRPYRRPSMNSYYWYTLTSGVYIAENGAFEQSKYGIE